MRAFLSTLNQLSKTHKEKVFIRKKGKINSNYLLSAFSRSQVGVCGKKDTTPKKENRERKQNKLGEQIGQAGKEKGRKVCGTNEIFIERTRQ